jgi:hypothetical protein
MSDEIKNEIDVRVESLRSFCEENGRQLLIIVDKNGSEDGRYLNVWSVGNSKHKQVDQSNYAELIGPFVHAIDCFVNAATGGVCGIQKK